jgi:threonylcarbamoyladenosine tRNA methylthiotransferase MtaB
MSDRSLISRRAVAISTLGCKLNQFESEVILTRFREAGYEVANQLEAADVCVVNTCAVTAAAERKGRTLLRSLHRRNPEAALLAVGCMAERDAQAVAGIDGVTAVLGNCEKEHILDFLPLTRVRSAPMVFVGETRAATVLESGGAVTGLLGRTRCFLKVQDGCSQKCTYCIIPQLRGCGRSLAIPQAVEQARVLAGRGFAELVITGVALGTYGDDLRSGHCLADLLIALSSVPGLRRIRLGSVEPWAINERLIEIMADSPVICPHLHVPLQSADDSVLRQMNRRYAMSGIARILERAFRRREDWGLGADIITGFPGEENRQFETTCRFLAGSPFSYLHVFPFSARPGTPAARLPGRVSGAEKRARVSRLRALDGELRQRFRRAHLGKHVPVLFEKRFAGGLLAGHAANYLDVYAAADKSLAGTIQEVTITKLHPSGVVGELVNQP